MLCHSVGYYNRHFSFSLLLQVQQEILQKRKEEKKAAVEAVKKFRKGKGEKPLFLRRGEDDMDDAFPVVAESAKEAGGGDGKGGQKRSGPKEKSKKRQKRVIFQPQSL